MKKASRMPTLLVLTLYIVYRLEIIFQFLDAFVGMTMFEKNQRMFLLIRPRSYYWVLEEFLLIRYCIDYRSYI